MKKINKNVVLMTAFVTTLSACNDAKIDGKNNLKSSEQVTAEQAVLELNYLESDPVVEIDLLADLTSPSGSDMFITKYETDETSDVVPYINELGANTDKHQVFIPSVGGVERIGNILKIQPFVWTDALAYGEVSTINLTYYVDNGYDNGNDDHDDDLFARKIKLTITGAEDKVEDILFNHPNGLEVNPGFSTKIETEVKPANATFKTLSFESSNSAVVTVSPMGIVSAADDAPIGTTFTITVKSQDGLVERTIDGIVAELVEPNGIAVDVNDSDGEDVIATQTTITPGTPKQLKALFLPLGADFAKTPASVTWESLDESKLMVDENGLVTVISKAEGNVNNINTVDVKVSFINEEGNTISTTLPVTIQDHPTNIIYARNAGFESGKIGTYWLAHGADADVTVTSEEANSGQYSALIKIDGGNSGIKIATGKELQFTKGNSVVVSWDIKIKSPVAENNYHMRPIFTLPGSFYQQGFTDGSVLKDGEWHSQSVTFDAVGGNGKFSGYDNQLLQFQLIMIKQDGFASEFYLDNISIEEVTPQ